MGLPNDGWVEVGWFNYYRSDGSRGETVFVEYGANGDDVSGVNWITVPNSCMNVGESDVWRVEHVGGGTWKLWINCIDGAGYRLLKTWDLLYTQGLAAGETGALGPDASADGPQMADEHRDLIYKKLSGTPPWTSWTYNQCWRDTAWRWDTYLVAADAFNSDWGPYAHLTCP